MIAADTIKILLPAAVAFFVGVVMTPLLTHYLYKYQVWKKKSGKVDLSGNVTPVFNALHKDRDTNTPRMGGVVIWGSVVITATLFALIGSLGETNPLAKFNFISRDQTWLLLFSLVAASLIGFVDDWLQVKGSTDHVSGGLSLKKRIVFMLVIGGIAGWWFYAKLGVASVGMLWGDPLFVGIFFIPLFMLVTLALFSSGVIDGIDGLAGGVMATIFSAYSLIAFFQNQIDIAAFCAVVVGGILAFLWFNIPPARFYMSETGILGLMTSLAVVAFMTDTLGGGRGLIALPVIAFPLIATTSSVVIQVLSKKFRNGQKVFRIAPLHHHFEALGWPPYKVTMRYWIISMICALLGIIVALGGSIII